jgi:hypothetical protein
MKRLVLALYAEGSTDERFLPPVIQRTAEQLLTRYEKQIIDIETRTIPRVTNFANRDECILEAARRATSYNILIIHSDADHPTRERALQERFRPGYELVQRTQESLCKSLVPIIPIRMTEAWMLAADHDLLREVIGTSLRAQELGLVNRARQVESDPNPKQTLKQIMQRAYSERPHRRHDIDLNRLYLPLGRRISLERLSYVPSYKQFEKDLTETFIALNLIPRIDRI